jgi:hypothetical protein
MLMDIPQRADGGLFIPLRRVSLLGTRKSGEMIIAAAWKDIGTEHAVAAARDAMLIIRSTAQRVTRIPMALLGSKLSPSDRCVGLYAPARSAFRCTFETAALAMNQ